MDIMAIAASETGITAELMGRVCVPISTSCLEGRAETRRYLTVGAEVAGSSGAVRGLAFGAGRLLHRPGVRDRSFASRRDALHFVEPSAVARAVSRAGGSRGSGLSEGYR